MNRYESKGDKPLRTKKTGLVVARDFTRIVHGGRGAYVEIADKDINKEAMALIKARHTYYDEYRAGDERVKFYYQRRTVKYADYKVGMWYVSPVDLEGFEVVGKYEVKRGFARQSKTYAQLSGRRENCRAGTPDFPLAPTPQRGGGR